MSTKTNEFIEVGCIPVKIARIIKMQPAKIYVSTHQIQHISNKHGVELQTLGISAIDYIKYVCAVFNQIRKGTGSSIILIVYNEHINHTACIDLNFSLNRNHGFWEIKTAEPRRYSTVKRKALLWEAAKHTSNGRGTISFSRLRS